MSEIKLNPCPFCGGADLHYYVDNFVRTYVECNTCGVKVQGAYNSKKGEKEAASDISHVQNLLVSRFLEVT